MTPGKGQNPSDDNSEFEHRLPRFTTDGIEDATLPGQFRKITDRPASGPLAINQTIDRYRVVEYVARGGLSHVYRAIDNEGEEYALKIGAQYGGGTHLDRALDESDKPNPHRVNPIEYPANVYRVTPTGISCELVQAPEIDLFIREEARILASYSYLGLPDFHEVIEHKGRPVIVSEFLRGSTLRQRMVMDERQNRMPDLEVLVDLAETLRYAQDEGLDYHGDLKPENLILYSDRTVALIDPAVSISKYSAFVTTPHYNPLLTRASHTDVMSLGIIMYEWYTKILPFDNVPYRFAGNPVFGETDRLYLSDFLSHHPPQDVNAKIPRPIAAIITKALTHPDYTIEQMHSDLDNFLHR